MNKIFFLLFLLMFLLDSCKSELKKNNEFDNGSNIPSIAVLDSAKIVDLEVLGKVWGFLKYYHPNIRKGDYNWDYELFRILPEIISCKNKQERNKLLLSWIQKFDPFEKETENRAIGSKIKLLPNLNWINDTSQFSKSLSQKLNEIKRAKRNSYNYYVSINKVSNIRFSKFENENPYDKFQFPDAGFRLLALFRYWNIIEYYYPDKYLIEDDWNKVLGEFIPKFINASGKLDYHLTVLTLIARIHDSHANIWYLDPVLMNYYGENIAPFEVSFVENKAVITNYYNFPGLSKNLQLQKGDIISKVNNKSISEIIKENLSITPASNYTTQLRNLAENLLRSNDTSLKVTFIRNGHMDSIEVPCYPFMKANFISQRFQKKDTCFKWIKPNIAYIYLGSIKNNYLARVMPAFLKAKGIVIDLRCYPTDVVCFNLGTYFMPHAISFSKSTYGSIQNPGEFIFADNEYIGDDNSTYYKGKIVILVNELAQSQSEYTAMALRVAPNAIIIGSTTAGSDGPISFFYLPGGIRTGMSGMGVYYPDGRETQRIGIIPDIEVKPTIKGIRENRDELLEKAIDIINKSSQYPIALTATLTPILSQ